MKNFFNIPRSSLTLVFSVFLFFFFVNVEVSSAQGFFGFEERPGCERRDVNGNIVDQFLPSLVICGRSQASGACPAYSQPCNLGDLVETGRRALIWIITIVLMILPVVIAYYGFLMIWTREFAFPGGGKLSDLKNKILWLVIYFVCLLGAWVVVRTIVDLTQVQTDRINTFLIEGPTGQETRIKARQFDFNR